MGYGNEMQLMLVKQSCLHSVCHPQICNLMGEIETIILHGWFMTLRLKNTNVIHGMFFHSKGSLLDVQLLWLINVHVFCWLNLPFVTKTSAYISFFASSTRQSTVIHSIYLSILSNQI